MIPWRAGVVVTLAASSIVGCSGQADAPSDTTIVRDSAGVEIVENWGPPGAGGASWEVDAAPFLILGANDTIAAEQFINITGALRLTNGNLAVYENISQELRFFGPAGIHLRTVRAGEGPGELDYANDFRPLIALAGDTVLVDQFVRRSWFAPDGSFLRDERVDVSALSRLLTPEGWCLPQLLPDQSRLGCTVGDARDGATECGVTASNEGPCAARVVRFSPDLSRVDTLGRLPGSWNGDLPGINAADSWMGEGGLPGRIYIAENPHYSISVWRYDGTLERIVRRMDGRRAPSDAERNAIREAAADEPGSPVAIPELLPAFSWIFVGRQGDLWIMQDPYTSEGERSVLHAFDAAGRFMGDIELPWPVWVMDVGPEHLVVVRRDELDVPLLQVHRVRRGG